MKFSIITICKNAADNIQRTVDSVLWQRFNDYEYIIIDGASDDGTVDIISSCISPCMKVTSEPDKGISEAFNKGIQKASGDVLFFLNSGDYFIRDDVLGMAAADIERNEADIYTYSVTSVLDPKWPESSKEGIFQWEKSLIPHQGTFFRKEVFMEIGLYNENYKARMDYDFMYRCRKAGKKIFFNPVTITHYDSNGISSTEKYLFEKEGLAIRLLYEDEIAVEEREIIDFLTGAKGGSETGYLEKIEGQRKLIEKDHKIMVAMFKWLMVVNGGCSLAEYFLRHNYHNVAIYGMGMLGKILHSELIGKQISVSYIIDRNTDIGEMGIVSWDEQWEPVDCIVVTPFYAYKEIKNQIRREKGDFEVLSLEDILDDMK